MAAIFIGSNRYPFFHGQLNLPLSMTTPRPKKHHPRLNVLNSSVDVKMVASIPVPSSPPADLFPSLNAWAKAGTHQNPTDVCSDVLSLPTKREGNPVISPRVSKKLVAFCNEDIIVID
jgi:hypothetical protein